MKAIAARRFAASIATVLLLVCTSLVASAADRPVIHSTRPVYPEMAKRMHVSGTVKLAVHITADGSVNKVEVLGGHPLLTRAAMDSVKQWKYQPGQDENRNVSVDFNMAQ